MNENKTVLETDGVDPDDAPELMAAFFDEATPKINDEVVSVSEVAVAFKKYVGDAEMVEILADKALLDDLEAGGEDIKAGRVTVVM